MLVDGVFEEADFLLVANVKLVDCFAELPLVCLELFDPCLEWILIVSLMLHLFKFDGYKMKTKFYVQQTEVLKIYL